MIFQKYYAGKRVLITGHTGFKGSWLSIWLKLLGAKVYGYALEEEQGSLFNTARLDKLIDGSRYGDISDQCALSEYVSLVKPDIVFHLAAEAIVGRAHGDPINAWSTNVIGTLVCLEVLRSQDRPIQCIVITSDKCYENKEWLWGYRESDQLGGRDMYSASKASAEILVSAYKRSYLEGCDVELRLATTRAGNVIGGGDRSRYRLVPDCIGGWERSEKVVLRNPSSTRPWQHVMEPLRGYLMVGYELGRSDALHGESFNFGPRSADNKSVAELVSELAKYWPGSKWSTSNKNGEFKECGLLSLNCDKATSVLGWAPRLGFAETASWTSSWYRSVYEGEDRLSLCIRQVEDYMSLLEG